MPSLVEIGQVILEEDFFFYFVNVFWLFLNYLPFEKDWALHLNKLESPSPKDIFCQVWLKLDQWFLRRLFIFVNVFSLFGDYLPLKKSWALHLNTRHLRKPHWSWIFQSYYTRHSCTWDKWLKISNKVMDWCILISNSIWQ